MSTASDESAEGVEGVALLLTSLYEIEDESLVLNLATYVLIYTWFATHFAAELNAANNPQAGAGEAPIRRQGISMFAYVLCCTLRHQAV